MSKALVVGAYQRKLEELARQPGIELTVVVPEGWREGLFGPTTRLERAHTSGYDLVVAPLASTGSFTSTSTPPCPRLLSRNCAPTSCTWTKSRTTWRPGLPSASGRPARDRALFFTWQNLERHYPWPFRHFELANYRRARYAIAGNPTAVEVLRAKGYAGPVEVIPQFGVDPGAFSPRPGRARQIQRHKTVIRLRRPAGAGERRRRAAGGLRAAAAGRVDAASAG